MPRTSSAPSRTTASATPDLLPIKPALLPRSSQDSVGTLWDMLAFRLMFAVICTGAGFTSVHSVCREDTAPLAGFLFAVAVILFEVRLREASLRRLIGAAIGSILGILGAYLISLIFTHTTMPESTRSFLSLAIFLVMTYIGLVLGANKGDMLNLQALGGLFGSERSTAARPRCSIPASSSTGAWPTSPRRSSSMARSLIPQFVLHELQLVADSADRLKRQRGRRGLEVLQRIQKMPHLEVQIAEDDFAQIADVDLKLIELAKRYDAKIVTNDYNLNKVATLQGIEVLNVNQLANALKPVVLPGETMRVFILREGKEYNQGVAYLDDGTMVVVDGGAQDDQQDRGHQRHVSPPDHGGQDDLRPLRRARRADTRGPVPPAGRTAAGRARGRKPAASARRRPLS